MGLKMSGLSILCREVNRQTGEISVYVAKEDASEEDFGFAKMRARINPGLTYYAVFNEVIHNVEYFEEILSVLKRRSISVEALKSRGGIVQL